MNFLDLLTHVEKRPLMYLSEKNIKILESFITGYYLCEGLNDIPSQKDDIFREKFFKYMKKKKCWRSWVPVIFFGPPPPADSTACKLNDTQLVYAMPLQSK